MREVATLVSLLHAVLAVDYSTQDWCKTECTHDNTSYIQQQCGGASTGIVGAEWVGNCCLSPNNTIIYGLDLRGCNLTSVQTKDFSPFQLDYFNYLDLSSNAGLVVGYQALQGMVALKTAVVDKTVAYATKGENGTCPGGDLAWNTKTDVAATWQCSGMINACLMGTLNETDYVDSNGVNKTGFQCPPNSNCTAYGPGMLACECDSYHNYHGYKCLKQGEFPYAVFFGILGPFTVAFSICCWFTQRRHVKKD